jgi:hypothetical protein
MGTPADKSSDVSTMCGAIRYCLEKLCYFGRRIPIGIILPIKRYDGDTTKIPTAFQYILDIAEEFSVPVLNMYTDGRILSDNMTPDGKTFYLQDVVHLGGNGVMQFERIMGKWIAYEL